MPVDNIYWIPVLLIAAYLPFLVVLDIKYRNIPYIVWIWMVPMFPVTGLAYSFGYYPMECMWISFIAVAIWFAAMKLHLFEGADFTLLAFISLFFVVNPLSGRVLMPLVLAEMLIAVFVMVNCIAFVIGKRMGHFPMIPVISIAFVMAVILG